MHLHNPKWTNIRVRNCTLFRSAHTKPSIRDVERLKVINNHGALSLPFLTWDEKSNNWQAGPSHEIKIKTSLPVHRTNRVWLRSEGLPWEMNPSWRALNEVGSVTASFTTLNCHRPYAGDRMKYKTNSLQSISLKPRKKCSGFYFSSISSAHCSAKGRNTARLISRLSRFKIRSIISSFLPTFGCFQKGTKAAKNESTCVPCLCSQSISYLNVHHFKEWSNWNS